MNCTISRYTHAHGHGTKTTFPCGSVLYEPDPLVTTEKKLKKKAAEHHESASGEPVVERGVINMAESKKTAEKPGAVTDEKTAVNVGNLSGGEVAGQYVVPAARPLTKSDEK